MAQASVDFHYDNTYNHGSYGKVNMDLDFRSFDGAEPSAASRCQVWLAE
jgi:hypothetical protein